MRKALHIALMAALVGGGLVAPAMSHAQSTDSSNRYPAAVQATGGSQTIITDPTLVPPPASASVLNAPLQVYPLAGYTVSWQPVTNASRYNLAANGSSVYNGGALSKAFAASGTVGTKTTYQVQACGQYDCAPWSNQVTTTVVAPPAPSTPAVTAPASVTVGDNFNVSWSASTDPVGYSVDYQVHGHKDATAWSGLYNGSGRSLLVTNAGPVNDHYYFQARACNPYACSGWGSAATRTTVGAATPPPPPPPPAPTLEGQRLTWSNGWASDAQCGMWTTQIHVYCPTGGGISATGMDGGLYGPATASYTATLVSGSSRVAVSVSCDGGGGGTMTDACSDGKTYTVGGRKVGVHVSYDSLFHRDCGKSCTYTATASITVY